jgi:O-antigen ligase
VYHRLLSVFNSSDTSISSRVPVYNATFGLIGDYPVTGVGLGNQLLKQMIDKGGYYHNATPFIHAHDIYLQIWAEMGIFGLLAFLGSMLTALHRGMCAVVGKNGPPVLRGLAAAGISGLAGILLFGLVDYPWSYPRVMTVFWMLFALTVTAARLAGRKGPEAEERS